MDNHQLMAAIPINLAQVQPELKQLRTGNEVTFSEALENKKIIHSSLGDLKNILKVVMIKIGLRSANWPSEEEKAVLIDHIIKNFGGHTCEEIKLAFEMAMDGKLTEINNRGDEVTVSANCFENFSCIFFSGIMKAYRSWAKEAIRHIPAKDTFQIEDKKEITDEEMLEWINDWKVKVKTINNPTLIPALFYDWLDRKGILNLTKEQKLDYIGNQAVSVRIYNLSELAKQEGEHGESREQLNEFNRMRNQGFFEGIEIERLRELAKKIAVFDYLIY